MAQKSILSPAQDTAANPLENIWVQANAGTGKTSVLVRRLLRILFRAPNVGAGGILCLTYTNAGAGEMRNRILAALRGWAMATDAQLRELLDGVAINNPATADDIAHAREIFFQYIDNPDVLKIKTIHGFCEEILRRFPIEAGLPPAWTLVSDANQRVLMNDAFDKLINTWDESIQNFERVKDAFAHIVGRVSENYLADLMDILSGLYKYFFQASDIDKYRKYFIDTIEYFLELNTPVPYDFSPEKLLGIINMATSDINASKKPVKYLFDIVNITKQYIDKTIDFEKYKEIYLKADGGKISVVSKKDYLADEQERVYRLNQQHASRRVFDDSVALFDLGAAFAQTYRDLKRQRSLLDFEDLILYTRKLFSNPDSMGWVLSQLDLSLTHILVDEAQDTSPLQWDILRMLSGDFFAEGDAGENPHSIFVVGDTKQSIYGFQGADPRAFAASRQDIAAQIQNNLRTIREIPLAQSFRSLSSILHAVDCFFSNPTVAQATGFANNRHACFRRGDAGMVEVHKMISRASDGTDVGGYIKTIADRIKSLVDSGRFMPHDIMVLVQNRHPMAAPLVSELKKRSVPVAGSDRIVLPNFPAIRDLMNLVRFCLDTTDDYSLCCVLKSPIFRLNEADIFNICKTRNEETKSRRATSPDALPETVFNVLRQTHPDIHAELEQFLQWADVLAPYSFFTRILDGGARAQIIAALGAQAIDPLEEFLTICLAYERTQPGTLRHFLKWFITGGSEIKRDMDAASGVRIATVHGSKGLEAPVVFLIDTARTPGTEQVLPITPEMRRGKSDGTDTAQNVWLWSPRSDDSVRRAAAADALMNVRIAEYYRLLYVAMTRARDHLYIYGYTTYASAPDISWHAQLWQHLQNIPGATFDGETIRIVHGE